MQPKLQVYLDNNEYFWTKSDKIVIEIFKQN